MFWRDKDKLSTKTWDDILARYANMLVHCYQKRDVTGVQVSVTALTHLCYSLESQDRNELKARVAKQFVACVAKEEGFPEDELVYIEWLVNHFFEIKQSEPAEFMLPWYQKIDDEWLVRKQLKAACPDKNSTELTAMMLYQAQHGSGSLEKAASQVKKGS